MNISCVKLPWHYYLLYDYIEILVEFFAQLIFCAVIAMQAQYQIFI